MHAKQLELNVLHLPDGQKLPPHNEQHEEGDVVAGAVVVEAPQTKFFEAVVPKMLHPVANVVENGVPEQSSTPLNNDTVPCPGVVQVSFVENELPGGFGKHVIESCTMVLAIRFGFGDAQVVVPEYSRKPNQFVGTVMLGTVAEQIELCETPLTAEQEAAAQPEDLITLTVPITAPVQVVPEKKVVTAQGWAEAKVKHKVINTII